MISNAVDSYLTKQSKNKNGSTANNATAMQNTLDINYLLLGVYFIMSVLLQYFSLNPA